MRAENRRCCPECGRKLDGLMAVHEDAPGLFALVRGEAGEPRRIMAVISLCLIVSFAIVAAEALLR